MPPNIAPQMQWAALPMRSALLRREADELKAWSAAVAARRYPTGFIARVLLFPISIGAGELVSASKVLMWYAV